MMDWLQIAKRVGSVTIRGKTITRKCINVGVEIILQLLEKLKRMLLDPRVLNSMWREKKVSKGKNVDDHLSCLFLEIMFSHLKEDVLGSENITLKRQKHSLQRKTW
jgi:hypothetical protein